MKTLLAIFLLFPSVAVAQWLPVKVSSATDSNSIQENFRRAAIYSNRKLDKYSPDTIYKKLTLKDDLVLDGGKLGIGTTSPSNAIHVKATTGIAVSSATTASLSIVFRGAETKANIKAYDPVAAGEAWYCTDCTTAGFCVSTGTAVNQYSNAGNKSLDCD